MSTEIESLRDDIRDLKNEREDLRNEIGSLEDDVSMWERRAYKAETAMRGSISALKAVEPTITDQLMRFDVRKSIEQLEEALNETLARN